ncbi:pentatricopeptide repeat (PPR) superfamily protein [Wolffia australiana]
MPLRLHPSRSFLAKHRPFFPGRPISTPPPSIPPPSSSADADIALISSSFREWFKSSYSPTVFDRIFTVLAACADDDDSVIDRSLSSLGLRLHEAFVFKVLHHSPAIPISQNSSFSNNFLLLRLKFFDWAGRQRDFRHTRVTYHAIFRLLSKARLKSVIHDWLHAFAHVPSVFVPRRHVRFHEILVVGYSIAGKPETALQVFGKMRFQGMDLSAFSYHVLLNSLVEEAAFDVADTVFAQIAARGLHCPFTHCIRIKSLCKQNRVDEAIALVKKELDGTMADQTAGIIVGALCKQRRFEEAGKLVDELGAERTYNVWILGLIEAGRTARALDFVTRKKELEGYSPDVVFYNRLLCRLLRENRLDKAYEVLVEMKDSDIVPDKTTMNSALCFFCKAGMVDVAVMLYNSRMEIGLSPNRLAFGNMINALCGEDDAEELCRILEDSLEHGYFPGKKTFWVLVGILCRKGKLEKMGRLLDLALQKDCPSTLTSAWSHYIAAYITALCHSNMPEEGYSALQKVASSTKNPKTGSVFTSLIRGFIILRRADMVCKLFDEMQEYGHNPSRSLYKEVICCLCETGSYEKVLTLLETQLRRPKPGQRRCYDYFIYGAGCAGKPELAMGVLQHMKNAGIEPGTETYIVMLSSYLKGERVSEALNFFYGLCKEREPSNRLYNLLITGLAKAGKLDQAVFFWKEVRGKGLVPSLQCYEELVLAFCSSGDYEGLIRILLDFEETGREVSPFVCNLLILHSLKHPRLWLTWQSMASNDLMLGQVISAFSGGVRIKEHLHCLDEVVEKYFPVDIFTFNVLLRALSLEGRMDYACELFDRISMKGHQPNRYTYDIILHGLCKQGRKEEAEAWKNKMVLSGFYPTWYTMELYKSIK